MKHAVKEMIKAIENDIAYTYSMTGKKKFNDEVMKAMEQVPREAFVPEHLKDQAYYNCPLPIGHGQTISQPYIVALMTELLQIEPDHIILEVGTGSGYQSAILSLLCKQVYSIERVEELSELAKKRFKDLDYNNIEAITGNGYAGYPPSSPYDGIIVTAAATHIPEPLKKQLKPGGKLVIPVGLSGMHQELMLFEKDQDEEEHIKSVLGVAFVPLINDSVSEII